MTSNKVLDGLFGLCIGDALGVPVEFTSRDDLKEHPVADMIGYGMYNQPPGTWSDDSSLAFCLAESLCNGYDLNDIASKFVAWYYDNHWTPHGEVFDVGNATSEAIERLKIGVAPQKAGSCSEYSNGNGSLMRILPLVFVTPTPIFVKIVAKRICNVVQDNDVVIKDTLPVMSIIAAEHRHV